MKMLKGLEIMGLKQVSNRESVKKGARLSFFGNLLSGFMNTKTMQAPKTAAKIPGAYFSVKKGETVQTKKTHTKEESVFIRPAIKKNSTINNLDHLLTENTSRPGTDTLDAKSEALILHTLSAAFANPQGNALKPHLPKDESTKTLSAVLNKKGKEPVLQLTLNDPLRLNALQRFISKIKASAAKNHIKLPAILVNTSSVKPVTGLQSPNTPEPKARVNKSGHVSLTNAFATKTAKTGLSAASELSEESIRETRTGKTKKNQTKTNRAKTGAHTSNRMVKSNGLTAKESSGELIQNKKTVETPQNTASHKPALPHVSEAVVSEKTQSVSSKAIDKIIAKTKSAHKNANQIAALPVKGKTIQSQAKKGLKKHAGTRDHTRQKIQQKNTGNTAATQPSPGKAIKSNVAEAVKSNKSASDRTGQKTVKLKIQPSESFSGKSVPVKKESAHMDFVLRQMVKKGTVEIHRDVPSETTTLKVKKQNSKTSYNENERIDTKPSSSKEPHKNSAADSIKKSGAGIEPENQIGKLKTEMEQSRKHAQQKGQNTFGLKEAEKTVKKGTSKSDSAPRIKVNNVNEHPASRKLHDFSAKSTGKPLSVQAAGTDTEPVAERGKQSNEIGMTKPGSEAVLDTNMQLNKENRVPLKFTPLVSRINELIQKLKGSVKQTSVKSSFKISAGKAGEVEIQLDEKTKEKTLKIIVESDKVRNELQKSLPQIQQNLLLKGIEFSSIAIDTAPLGSKMNQAQDQQRSTHKPKTKQSKEVPNEQEQSPVAQKNYGYNTIEVIA